MTPDRHPGSARLADRVGDLLADARLAREAGDFSQLRALATAVLALDPANAEADALMAGSAERRQMTLMFCDLVGSTAIADVRDPEEMGEILGDYRATCAAVIERFGGFVEDHRGDGMLVRFGYPEVHEDDARRAVLSGLAMVRAVRERAGRPDAAHAVDLHIRVAVHTDLVVIDGGDVMGSAANEASRLQDLAEPDTVVISDATQALVADHFDLESMGETRLRGVSRPVEAYTVRGERVSDGLAAGAAPTPFAGRRDELDRIEAVWHEAGEGTGALLVTGPAGIGKSRLVVEGAGALDARCTFCRCSSYHEATSLFPFIRLLERACAIADADREDARLAKLRARLGPGPDLPFLAAALGVSASSLSPPGDVDPTKLRNMAIAAAALLVGEEAGRGRGPSMLIVDDLHWADQSSLDLISVLLGASQPGFVMVLVARDGFAAPWPESVVPRLPLHPLTAEELEQMSVAMPEGSGLSARQRDALVARSDGVPLFLEELVRTSDAVERGRVLHRSLLLADYEIPPALRDPLLARLAAPGVDLALVQTAATIGREVDRALLRQVAAVDADVFDGKLDTLIAAGLVDRWGGGAIRFRHELIREVAYETQRRSARRERHSRVADRLLRDNRASPRGDAGEAAFHLERAERYDESVAARLTTAQAAQALGAHTEATTHLTHALAALAHLPAGAPRDQTELTVRELRSFSAVMAGGYAAPEAAEDHPRCVELADGLGLTPELLPGLTRSWSYYAFRGNLAAADDVAATLQRRSAGEGVDVPHAFVGRGLIGFFRGRFGEARRLMEAFVDEPWAGSERRPPESWQLPNDPLASVAAHLVPTLWIGGEPEAAEAMAARALQRTDELEFPYGPFSAGYVHSLLAMTRRLDGDHAAAARHAGAMLALGERHGFAMWSLVGALQAGLSAVRGGDGSGLEQLVGSVATWRTVLVAEVWTPYWLTELAAAQRTAGRHDDALGSLDEALAVAHDTGSAFYAAETLRLRGELRCALGDRAGVTDLQAAVATARTQEAPAFQRRAEGSLARARAGGPR